MRIVNLVIGCLLLALSLLHLFIPHNGPLILMYGAGAVFALIATRTSLNNSLARLFAVATTALMFFYFAGFFKMAAHFHEYWYKSGAGLEGVGLLLSAFAMIPVLSSYSCFLKADCEHATSQRDARSVKSPAFFSVPETVQDKPG